MKKRIKSNLLLLSCVLLASFCYGQGDIKNRIAKNILAYHIRYGLDAEIGVKSNQLRSINYLNKLVPFCDYELELYLTEDTVMLYPIDGYKIYNVENPGFTFSSPKEKIKINNFHSFMADRLYLIAYNKAMDDLKFISGNMFLSPVSVDFNVSSEKPDSLLKYLNYRYYNYKLKEISYLKKKRNVIFYKAFSKTLNEELFITVNILDLNDTKIGLMQKKNVY